MARKQTKHTVPSRIAASSQALDSQSPNKQEGLLRIRLYGDPVLRENALAIQKITDVERKLAEEMLATMYATSTGVGLAAPQVGVLQRLIVIDVNREDPSSKPLVLINPEIQSLEGEVIGEEGCLSFPDITAEVKRAAKAVVTGLNLEEETICVEGDGLLARVLQHEIDHLNGVLFIDHLSGLKRQLLRGKLRKLRQQ